MDALNNVVHGVDKLLARLDLLIRETDRLADEKSVLARDNSVLARENQALQAALMHERALRSATLERIDALIQLIKDHGGMG